MPEQTAQIVVIVFTPIFVILVAVVGVFLKKILTKLDSMVTESDCAGKQKNCKDSLELRRETAGLERKAMTDRIEDLVDSFDSLCKCLYDFTKGVCPRP